MRFWPQTQGIEQVKRGWVEGGGMKTTRNNARKPMSMVHNSTEQKALHVTILAF